MFSYVNYSGYFFCAFPACNIQISMLLTNLMLLGITPQVNSNPLANIPWYEYIN